MARKKSRNFQKFSGEKIFDDVTGKEEKPRSLWAKLTEPIKRLESKYPIKDGISEIALDENPEIMEEEIPVLEEKVPVNEIQKIKKPALLPELSPEKNIGSDKRTFEKLRKGKFPIEARLDLHGMKLEEAHRAVIYFIDDCHKRGNKCVLIITGKGKHSSLNRTTINSEFASWLNSSPIRMKIVCFTHAAIRDGGSGAFYVLLKSD